MAVSVIIAFPGRAGTWTIGPPRAYSLTATFPRVATLLGIPEVNSGGDSPGETSINPKGVADALNDPVQQRSRLLPKALETQSLNQALELARARRRSIHALGWPGGRVCILVATLAENALITEAAAVEIASTISPLRPVEVARLTPDANRNPLKQRNSFTLLLRDMSSCWNVSPDERVMRKFAREFGLSVRQVQGVRMRSKREIARRHDRAREVQRQNRRSLTGSCALIIWPSVMRRVFARSNPTA